MIARPPALIERRGNGLEDSATDPMHLIWGNSRVVSWEDFYDDGKPAEYDRSTNLYRIARELDSPELAIVIEVDGSKGWLPVNCRISLPNGPWVFKYECSDIRPLGDGLYFPYRVEYWASGMHTPTPYVALSVFEMKDVKPNVLPVDEPLDIVFPDGTDVQDLIANLHYVVDRQVAGWPCEGGPHYEHGRSINRPTRG